MIFEVWACSRLSPIFNTKHMQHKGMKTRAAIVNLHRWTSKWQLWGQGSTGMNALRRKGAWRPVQGCLLLWLVMWNSYCHLESSYSISNPNFRHTTNRTFNLYQIPFCSYQLADKQVQPDTMGCKNTASSSSELRRILSSVVACFASRPSCWKTNCIFVTFATFCLYFLFLFGCLGLSCMLLLWFQCIVCGCCHTELMLRTI